MENPIQQVLAAERETSREILEQRAAADRAVSAARQSAKALLEKTERRVNGAIARFEQQALEAREARAAAIRERAAQQMHSYFEQIDSQLSDIVSAAFAANWPARKDD